MEIAGNFVIFRFLISALLAAGGNRLHLFRASSLPRRRGSSEGGRKIRPEIREDQDIDSRHECGRRTYVRQRALSSA